MKLSAENLSFSYGKREILKNLSLEIPAGKLTFLLGANGSGKSTLLKLLCGLLAPQQGRVYLEGKDLKDYSAVSRAKHLGVMLQKTPPALDFTAEEFVLFGRTAKLSRLSPPGEADLAAVSNALSAVGMTDFARRHANALSGGEFQRLVLGSVLALESEVLLLDEPSSAQDPAQAAMIFELLSRHVHNKSILVISHDLTLARHFAQHVLLLKDGTITDSGTPEQTLVPEKIKDLYSLPLPEFFLVPDKG